MEPNTTVLVTGASSGIGKSVAARFAADGHEVISLAREPSPVHGVESYIADLNDPARSRDIIGDIETIHRPSWVVHCAGVNAIAWLEDVDDTTWDRLMRVNAQSIMWLAQELKHWQTMCVVTSNAAWTPMTNSLAYNASKAAAHMAVRQLARELTPRTGQVVFDVAPNKVGGTGMSAYIDDRVTELRGWSAEEAKEYQLKSLLVGRELTTGEVAAFIKQNVELSLSTPAMSGCTYPIGA